MSATRVDGLESDSRVVGDAWVEDVRRALRLASRRITGGWPGTLREARALAYAHFAAEAGTRRWGVLSPEELESASRVVYSHARRQWLTRAED